MEFWSTEKTATADIHLDRTVALESAPFNLGPGAVLMVLFSLMQLVARKNVSLSSSRSSKKLKYLKNRKKLYVSK